MSSNCNYCGEFIKIENNDNKQKIFSKCNSGNCENKICKKCVEMTIKRAKNDSFYSSYISWCDTCIWFDIS